MNGFGHHHAFIAGTHLDAWGKGPLLLRHEGREWWFEFSDMFGPTLLRKSDLEPSDKQPISETHPFWEPFNMWFKAGKKHRPVRDKRGRIRFFLCRAPMTPTPQDRPVNRASALKGDV